ncbi:Aste57867_12702 [Aphanomyces stellatus]|uniref:Aste57867_12702 protein n=1 Tax=Aphanomyces stellatus TaxID=120398 RepID=A0A485KWB6_9STRA|nr:hypothetical protein As57867_012654 [Aphanomyces stellatus]VFT89552.1 Aste57867_12702 [Aphanomyces stellatus]
MVSIRVSSGVAMVWLTSLSFAHPNPMPDLARALEAFDLTTSSPPTAGPLASIGTMTNQDYAFLQLPPTQQLLGLFGQHNAAMFNDSRLDVWTTMMAAMVKSKTDKWTQPHANTSLTIPKVQKTLVKITLLNTQIQVPVEDEDWPDDTALEVQAATYIRDVAPFVDNFKDTWQDGESLETYVMSKVRPMWPPIHVVWFDRYSDHALELLAFHGVGAHLVEQLSKMHTDGSYYALKLNFMDELDVRPGFAKYGADAYFDKSGRVVKLVRQGQTYGPRSDNWDYIKMAFRGSLMTKVTAIDHLMGLHMTVGNYFVTGSREQLPPDHPLRRLLKPFTFRTIAINHAAARSLMWTKGYLHRALALSEKGLAQTWQYAIDNFKYETFPQQVARRNIDTKTIPFDQDGLSFWTVTRAFVSQYVDVYYASDAAVTGDAPVVAFWAYLNSKLHNQLQPLSKAALKDTIAQAILSVTAMHNHMGSVAEYVSDPSFMPGAWVEGELASRPGPAVRQAVIMAMTGLTEPSILEDFSHVMLHGKAKTVCRAFKTALVTLGQTLDVRNSEREQPLLSFHPRYMDISIGI